MVVHRDGVEIPASAWERPQTQEILRDRDFAGLLGLARTHGASQTRIAAVTGMAQGRVSEILAGRRTIDSLHVIERIADGLDMPDQARTLLGLAPQSGDGDATGRVATDAGTLAEEVHERVEFASIDDVLVDLFTEQTQGLRLLDRRLGARHLLAQNTAHVQQMHDLLRRSMPGKVRSRLAQALAQASSLAGWQALDSGRRASAWRFYELAKTAANESEDPFVRAHVSTEQVYVLLDSDRAGQALAILRQMQSKEQRGLPPLLRAWLWAVEGEVQATLGQETRSQVALDRALSLLPSEGQDPDLPYLMLDRTQMLRWRGHCLARLGHPEAIFDLTCALDDIVPLELGRAEAGLRTDLASALAARGELSEARLQAQSAAELSERSASARQRARLSRLLRQMGEPSVSEQVQEGHEGA